MELIEKTEIDKLREENAKLRAEKEALRNFACKLGEFAQEVAAWTKPWPDKATKLVSELYERFPNEQYRDFEVSDNDVPGDFDVLDDDAPY